VCLRGEPCPSLQRFVFVYRLHRYTLLARGLPATVVATWLGTSRSMIPARTVVPPTLVNVCHDCGRDGMGEHSAMSAEAPTRLAIALIAQAPP